MPETTLCPEYVDGAAKLQIELAADPTVNYAIQQNDVCIIKRLRLRNLGAEELGLLQVCISSEPAFAHRWECTVEQLAAEDTCDLGKVDLKLVHDFLAGLTEAVKGYLHVTVRQGDTVIAEHSAAIDVLAYNEWNGSRALPELLAAFVLPNHPQVERILRQASDTLKGWTGDPSFTGYQRKDTKLVRLQAAAIYTAIVQQQIAYCILPASFQAEGQKIRTPDRVVEGRLGNCLDLSTLFAACFEQAGLRPLVIMLRDHAFPGVWLVEESFANSAVDDATAIRKRVDLGEICVLEATLAVEGHGALFETAAATARASLDDANQFLYALDVRRARAAQIRPLPVRSIVNNGAENGSATTDPTVAPANPINPIAPTPIVSQLENADELDTANPAELTPADRLDRWKRKLLDLSLRNPLINFRETKGTVRLLLGDVAALDAALASGRQFELMPRPQDWEATPRDLEVHRQRTGNDAQQLLLAEELQQSRLRCDLEATELSRRLLGLFRSARTSLEENGTNTLYLALGMLVWYESTTSDKPRQAPILLVPIELQRRSTYSGFTVRRSDEDLVVNVTLLEMLRHEWDLQVDGLEQLLDDAEGNGAQQVMDAVRQAVKQIPRWEVLDAAYCGLFSFTKYLMWRDLEVRTEQLKQNKLVSSLINFPHEDFPVAGGFPQAEELDNKYQPEQTFCPVSADSSQLAAVYAAAAGKTFVLHGPPGTGKSQTITNLIAHVMANGKTVLFVAEKMAALSVVQQRLQNAGLGPFCLELHSNKSKKADVIRQLGESLELSAEHSATEWRLVAQRLVKSRAELNAYVRALHQPRLTGESCFTGLAQLMALRDAPRLRFDQQMVASLTLEELARRRDQVRSLAAAGRACGCLAGHVWSAVRCQTWTPQLRDGVYTGIQTIRAALEACRTSVNQVAPIFQLNAATLSWDDLCQLGELANLCLTRAYYPVALVNAADWDEASESITGWCQHGRERDELRSKLYSRYTERLLQLNLEQLLTDATAAAQQWALPRWLTNRRVFGALQQVIKPGQQVPAAELIADLEQAIRLRQEEQIIAAAGERARSLLGRLWRDGEADWGEVEAAREWALAVRHIAANLAGLDAKRAIELRAQWAALMQEQSAMLAREGTYGRSLQAWTEALGELTRHKQSLSTLLSFAAGAWGDSRAPGHLEHLADLLDTWEAHAGELRAWCEWRKQAEQAAELQLGPLVAAYESGSLAHDQVEKAFERGFYEGWVDQIVGEEDALRRFTREAMEGKIAHFRQLDDQYTSLTRQEIFARLAARIQQINTDGQRSAEMRVLRRELGKKTRHMALRTLFQQIANLLPTLKPCLLMSPMSVAQYLDPAHQPFDLVVFDEASQVPTWDAVGAIARGAQCIVVGDPKQLPPTSFFAKGESAEEDDTVTEDLESILDDLQALQIPEMKLLWHYRSRHESLITFSNYQYYNRELLTFPSPSDGSAVSIRHVKGTYDRSKSRTNRAEAEAVVQEVVSRLMQPGYSKSIGVVTFNLAQQHLIEDLLEEARREYPEIDPYFDHDASDYCFVKNLENVQGDERDVILFSVCYGFDEAGKMTMNFGPLNRTGGQRRLNVAITRARQEVVVFSSINPEDIDLTKTSAIGVEDLKLFLEYAERGVKALTEQARFAHHAECESPFEQDVYDQLVARGYKVQKQVGCSGYRIDLAVSDPVHPGQFILGVECDGANYHRAKTARDRDRLRQDVLNELGWRLHRIWSTDWWQNRAAELQRLEAAIAAARAKVDGAPILAPAVGESINRAMPAVEPQVRTRVQAVTSGQQLTDDTNSDLERYRTSSARPSRADCAMDFYSREVAPALRSLVAQVVKDEGPVSLGLLTQRVAAWWGLDPTLEAVQERVNRISTNVATRVVQDGTLFLWPNGQNPAAYKGFRVPSSGFRRRISDLPFEEIANAGVYVQQRQAGLAGQDLVYEVAALFGYERLSKAEEKRLRKGLKLLEGGS